MKRTELIDRWKQKLADNITESRRQMEFAGGRLGVFAALRDLERERRRIAKRLIELDPEGEREYVQHLF
jgi:hypothetical protein